MLARSKAPLYVDEKHESWLARRLAVHLQYPIASTHELLLIETTDGSVLVTLESGMRNSTRSGATNGSEPGTLLYVTDVVMSDSDEGLDAACELADRTGSQLELIHVVDLGKAPSKPDAHMGIQYRLEMLARKLRHLKRNVASILLFGSPEDVISKRAADIKARLIAFGRNGSSSPESQHGLVRRIMRRVACPVIFLPSTAVKLSNKRLREADGEAHAVR